MCFGVSALRLRYIFCRTRLAPNRHIFSILHPKGKKSRNYAHKFLCLEIVNFYVIILAREQKMAKNKEKKDIDSEVNEAHNVVDDVVFEESDEEGKSLETSKKVREKLKKCEEEKKEYLDGWQRAKADFINMRKRDEEDRVKAVKYAREEVLQSVIPVIDSFEMAFTPESEKVFDKNWLVGMKGIQTQLLNTLKEYNVTQMNPLGEEFDPNLHDSVESKNTDDKKKDGKITEVRQKGYEMDGKVIRAAKVVVYTFKG